MILSTCGASAAGFHTTSFAWRAAWARRTSHHEAVVARAVAVPARCKTPRRVSIQTSLPLQRHFQPTNWLRVLQISLTYCSIEGKLIQEMQSTRYKRGYCTMSALATNT